MNFKNLSLKIRTRLARAIAFASVVLLLTMIGTSPVNGQSPRWNITVVEDVALEQKSNAIALNNYGDVLLSSVPVTGVARLAVYSPSVGVEFIDEMLSPEDAALWQIYHSGGGDINDAGHVIASGKFRDAMGQPIGDKHAVRVTLPAAAGQFAVVEDLGVAVGATSTTGYALNSFGDIAGGSQQAFLWSQSDGMAMLPVPVGVTFSQVLGMNDDAELVGGYNNRAVYWAAPDVSPFVIPVIANGPNGPSNDAEAIDSRGLVVGKSSAGRNGPAIKWRAMSYDTATGQLKNLGSFGGDSFAFSINDLGYITGIAYTKNNAVLKAFYYTNASGMKDLLPAINNFPSGATIQWPANSDINQFNDIALTVTLSDGRIRPALLRPVQLP